MKAWTKYCGCCNPRTDMECLGRVLRGQLAASGFTPADDADSQPELAVVLNGCENACGERWAAVESSVKVVLTGTRCDLWRRDGQEWRLVASSQNGYEGVVDGLRTISY